jgi:hypothetical protein
MNGTATAIIRIYRFSTPGRMNLIAWVFEAAAKTAAAPRPNRNVSAVAAATTRRAEYPLPR